MTNPPYLTRSMGLLSGRSALERPSRVKAASALPQTPTWKRGERYESGDLVRWADREWVALFKTGDEPGTSAWIAIGATRQ